MGGLWLTPHCEICRCPLYDVAEMHEALVTRGDVQGLPWETQIQIFCSQNISLIHPECHKIAQWTTRGKRIVVRHIVRWNGVDSVREFLRYMINSNSSAAEEAMRRLNVWNL